MIHVIVPRNPYKLCQVRSYFAVVTHKMWVSWQVCVRRERPMYETSACDKCFV